VDSFPCDFSCSECLVISSRSHIPAAVIPNSTHPPPSSGHPRTSRSSDRLHHHRTGPAPHEPHAIQPWCCAGHIFDCTRAGRAGFGTVRLRYPRISIHTTRVGSTGQCKQGTPVPSWPIPPRLLHRKHQYHFFLHTDLSAPDLPPARPPFLLPPHQRQHANPQLDARHRRNPRRRRHPITAPRTVHTSAKSSRRQSS
jgi:hypothetical protein